MAGTVEVIKREKDGFDSWEDLRRCSVQGFDSIGEEDLERFKWFGICHESPKHGHFMLRIRIPGGQLDSKQLRVIGELSKEYARGFADITTRQDIQLHWLIIEDIPRIIDKLGEVGLTTKGTSGDTVANITSCPVAGFDKDEIYDTSTLVADMSRYFLKNKKFSNLPRKFKIAVSGCALNCSKAEINDVGLVVVKENIGGEDHVGFDLMVGGGLSSAPHLATSLGIFLRPEEIIEVCTAALEIFRDQGNRARRDRARFKFLVDDWGQDKFRNVLESKVKREFVRLTESSRREYNFADHLGVHEQKQPGYYYWAIPIPGGRITTEQMIGLAELGEIFGDGSLRTTNMQNVVILNIAERNLSQLDSELHKLELSVGSSPLEKRVVCCVGKEFCKYGLVDTKGKWREIVENIRLDLPFDEDIKIHISGCPHGCAEHLVADIGLQGCLCKLNGKDVEAFDIKVGGGLGKEAMFARSIESKVPIDITKMKIEKLLNTYIQNRADGENFKDFCARHTQQQLAEFVKVDRVPR